MSSFQGLDIYFCVLSALCFCEILSVELSSKQDIVIAGLFPMSPSIKEGEIGRGVRPAVDLALKMINEDDKLLPDHRLLLVANDTQNKTRQESAQVWARSWIRRHARYGAHHLLIKEMSSEAPKEFKNITRMDTNDFEEFEHFTPFTSLQCDMAVATKFFFDMVDSNSTMVMVFGDACSAVSGPIAEISKEWNVWLLSYADMDPVLSDRSKYRNFYRTVPSDNDFNPARLALLHTFNWTRVATIFQGVSKGSARYGHAHNNLMSVLGKTNIEVIKSVGFGEDPEPAVAELQSVDARIIIGNFDENMARLVFCHAYKRGMFGPKYQWIILGGYNDDWWTVEDPSIPCTVQELNMTLHGYLATDILPLSSSKRRTESGLTPEKYFKRYMKANKGEFSKYHAYAFDGVWVIAKVVEHILKQQSNRPEGGVLQEGLFRGDRISLALNGTNFKGVTGTVQFDRGDRVGSILVEQFQGGKMIKLGEYHKRRNRLSFKTGSPIMWIGKGPPIDRKFVRQEFQRVPKAIYISICTVAGLGIILACMFLGINIIFRQHRYIKMSSPNLNNSIIIGCILTYLSVFLLGADGGLVPAKFLTNICAARAWVLANGFTLAFGAMFAKTWRVHAIFTNIKPNKKVIKDFKLFVMIAILLLVDDAILSTWKLLDPLHRSTKNLTTIIEGDLDIIPVVEYCKSTKMTVWLALIYAYKGMLLVFGCFLAWETRQVTIPALNDSKYIGMSVYNVVIMCICGAAVSVVINDQPTASFVIIGLFIIFCTTITLCLVFVPKIVELKRDPSGEERRIRAKLCKTKKKGSREEAIDWHKKNEALQKENVRYRAVIAEKIQLLKSLMEQLGEDTRSFDVHYCMKSPLHKKIVELRLTDSPGRHSTGSSNSEGDNNSVYSEISASNAWTFGKNPSNRLCAQLTRSIISTSTDISFAESMDDSGRRPSSRLSTIKSSTECIETDEEDDEFGGVYCGPPTTCNSIQNSSKENGRTKTVTEVHPLIHDLPNKSYLTTEEHIYKPYKSNETKSNSGDDDVLQSRPTSRLKESKGKMSLGNKRRFRKINFMFPNQEEKSKSSIVKRLTGMRQESIEESEYITEVTGISCDVIEHI